MLGGLTAEYTYEYGSTSGDTEGATEFVWEISDSENGAYTPIEGATAKIYCPTAEQTGKYIRVRITPVDKNEISGAEAVTAGIQVTDTAIEYFVATNGDDKNPGTMEKPFATLGDTSDLKNNGKLFSNYDRYMAGSEEKSNLQYSYKVCQIPTSDRVISRNSVQSTMSAIGYKYRNPIRALKLVQLLHEDEYLLNLLCYGIEGRDYTKDPSNPKRMIRDTDSYYISEFLIGSQFLAYLAPAYSDDVWEKTKEENENAKIDPNIGFAFDRKPVERELSNISAVSGEYNGLEKGLYDNYEEMFAEMQEKLELAGSKIVKDEIERQHKDWKDKK